MHHLELVVSSLADTCQFYDSLLVEHLGFQVYQEWSAGRSYRKDSFYLVFVQAAPHKKDFPYNRTHVGLNHLAFHAHSKAQVQQLHDFYQEHAPEKLLYEQDFPYAGGPEHFALYLEDPDRFKVEIVAPTNEKQEDLSL